MTDKNKKRGLDVNPNAVVQFFFFFMIMTYTSTSTHHDMMNKTFQHFNYTYYLFFFHLAVRNGEWIYMLFL